VNKPSRESTARSIARGERELAALRPFFRRDEVESKVAKMFPNQINEVWEILNEYQSESEELTCRIHLDALKLSEGNTDALREQIKDAQEDIRFVIAPAENPRLFRPGMEMLDLAPQDEQDRESEADIKEYLDWIQG
jgi:hypothetical protein